MKKILYFLVPVLVLAFLFWYSNFSSSGALVVYEGPVQLSTSEKFHNFGVVSMKDGVVSYDFVLKNISEDALVLKRLYTSCMCTEAVIYSEGQSLGNFSMPGHGREPRLNHNLFAGEEVRIEVKFNPAAHGPSGVGAIERNVVLETEKGEQVVLNIKANVTP
ncbi:MAG: DUF1573 domain-containing protein [bacterium]|nr:DUF1573 domain-containing protein [bacterium]